jgi:hypothetical protein
MKAPGAVQLPSARVVALDARGSPTPRERRKGAPLFSEVIDLVESGDLAILADGKPIAPGDLELRDFHALRAIATKLGWLAEEEIEFPCRNCGAPMKHRPCAAMEMGPFVDRELGDPELDRTRAPGEPLAIDGLGEVVLQQRTAAQALPLFRALRRRRLVISAGFVRGMGIVRVGDETEPARIAKRLERCSDAAFGALGDLFLETHYPPRLFSIAVCPKCGARNDIDAPFERELEPSLVTRDATVASESSFPSFDDFDERAHAIFRELSGGDDGDVQLVVEGGVPACDDGGEPLLGSYVPPYAGDMTTPSRSPEVTVFYRTFRAIWDEEGAYDWDAELRETIEHELLHHEGHLSGHDAMDDEERRAIDEEAVRVVGKKAVVRGSAAALAWDFREFLRRTWPIWLLLIAITLLVTLFQR